MFKLFFAPKMAKIYYKETRDQNEKKIIEELYDYYYHHSNQVEKELKKAILERKIPLINGREQSALIINEVNKDVYLYGKTNNYPEDLVILFIQ